MKKLLACAAVAFGMLAAPAAFAQNTDTQTANGSVTIIRPLVLTKNADLVFGRIVKPSSASATVSIANNSNTVSAGTGVALGGITTSHAAFTADGEGGQAVTVTVPANFVLSNGTPADNMTVTLSPSVSGSTALDGELGGAGTLDIAVGGSFSLASTQPSGAYTGTFNVTVAYQ